MKRVFLSMENDMRKMINISAEQMQELKRVKRAYQEFVKTDRVSQSEFVMFAVEVLENTLKRSGAKF